MKNLFLIGSTAVPSLFDQNWPKARKPRRAWALEKIECAVPWERLVDLLGPEYQAAANGRPGYPLAMMLRLAVLGWVFDLSNDLLEDTICDSRSAAAFVGIDPWQPRPPGASTISRFRAMINRQLGSSFGQIIEASVGNAGMQLRRGVIVEPVIRST